jgi:hypothetical protein
VVLALALLHAFAPQRSPQPVNISIHTHSSFELYQMWAGMLRLRTQMVGIGTERVSQGRHSMVESNNITIWFAIDS